MKKWTDKRMNEKNECLWFSLFWMSINVMFCFIYLKYHLRGQTFSQSYCSESIGIGGSGADISGGVWLALDFAEVGRVSSSLSAGSGLRVELGVSPCAASPGNGSAVGSIDVWEWVSSDDGSGWPSWELDSGGGSDKSEEFHFYY
mgnify:CR=1 FL=1